ncbi:GNAT family N-acetyltransferase [Microvirga subterranea]|uniref:Putative acetyltransferase n=1 Tax=Microvirga subterranea TaxID=186651 RepID=A0A370HIW9_9HYPH|nr:GNAT family N-acetyltransferase [Microvirga subterranea]RDI58074.1 putative acetyltransferase [Microvirga subterranea]
MEPQQSPSEPPNDRDVTIRAVRLDDCEQIAALVSLPGFRFGTLALPHRTPEDVRKRIESGSPADVGLVAVHDGTIIGNGGLTRFQGRRAHAASLGMGIHDDWRGRGVGSRLLNELLTIADDWLDLRRIELTVYVDNAPAIALYERNGFRVEGTHKVFAFRNGSYVDAHAMARLKP